MILMRRARHCRATWAALAFVAAAAGCAAPQIDHPFDGLQSFAPAAASPGVADPARLFIIHGITTQPVDYADPLVAALAGRLAISQTIIHDQSYPVSGAVGFDGANIDINLRTYHLYDGTEERLRVTALDWSPLTASIKEHQFRRDDEISRAVINEMIKTGVLNDGLSDAALYLGSYQAVMRRGVMIGLCAFLDGRFVNDQCIPTTTSHASVALLSESLGSYMLFDAIEALDRSNANSPAGAPLFSRLRQFYMFANQIPLLELAELKPHPGAPETAALSITSPKLSAFLDRVRRSRSTIMRRTSRPEGVGPVVGRAELQPLEIVAFTDPNDLLSYELRRENYWEARCRPPSIPNDKRPLSKRDGVARPFRRSADGAYWLFEQSPSARSCGLRRRRLRKVASRSVVLSVLVSR